MNGMHASTYRLQVNGDFPLDAAARCLRYLKDLGIGAAYLSPLFAAAPGSKHGYDVCDPSRINPEAGGEEGLEILADALRETGLGCILDIVPNHMAADPRHNPWWRDVLARGPDSPYAKFFDIDWSPRKAGLRGKVLLPVLESSYGETLAAGELRLDIRDGDVVVAWHDTDFPLNPEAAREFLGDSGDPSFAHELGSLNGTPGDAASFDGLHALLESQSYRLGHWRTALHEANYRRFFDVSTLLGLRVEVPEAFDAAHAKLRELLRAGIATGVRVDHVDGLREPEAYLTHLRALLGETAVGKPVGSYLVVEKILQEDEDLPGDWPVEGTTGYEFLSDLNGLFVDPRGLEALRAAARRISVGRAGTRSAEEAAEGFVACKRHVLSFLMRSELNLLADQLDRLSEADRSARDFTRDDLRLAIRETMAALGVYRTYGRDGYLPPVDARAFEAAAASAAGRNPATDPGVFRFLRDVFFSFEGEGAPPVRGIPREDRLAFALRFQQVTGSVTAKGVEDTAFYRDPTLLSLNEVGSSPALQGTSVARFHERMGARRRDFPLAMLCTSTHDTKRGEDARARLNVLTAHPGPWREALSKLSHGLELPRRSSGVSPNDEAFLYQTLVGSWPVGPGGEPAPVEESFHLRVEEAWTKAARESKLRTNWIRPDLDYEAGLRDFLAHLLRGPGMKILEAALFPLLKTCAREGAIFSLSQVACKCAAPGIPDVYQGSEFWELSMVDPDNRRPVDFDAREASLADMLRLLDPDGGDEGRKRKATALLNDWPDGRIKQYLLGRCLRWRGRHPELFLRGDYEAVEATGKARKAVVAFRRRRQGRELLVAFPVRPNSEPSPGRLLLPGAESGARFRHLFTGTPFVTDGRGIRAGFDLAGIFGDFPVAWLWRET